MSDCPRVPEFRSFQATWKRFESIFFLPRRTSKKTFLSQTATRVRDMRDFTMRRVTPSPSPPLLLLLLSAVCINCVTCLNMPSVLLKNAAQPGVMVSVLGVLVCDESFLSLSLSLSLHSHPPSLSLSPLPHSLSLSYASVCLTLVSALRFSYHTHTHTTHRTHSPLQSPKHHHSTQSDARGGLGCWSLRPAQRHVRRVLEHEHDSTHRGEVDQPGRSSFGYIAEVSF